MTNCTAASATTPSRAAPTSEGSDYLEGSSSWAPYQGSLPTVPDGATLIAAAPHWWIARDAQNNLLLSNWGENPHYAPDEGDVLDGGAGNDIIAAGDGDDLVLGGDGDDVGQGNGGDDVIFGGSGDDSFLGDTNLGRDADIVGDDYLDGGDGADVLAGQGGADVVIGGDGADMLFGDYTTLVATARDGADWLDGGAGKDRLEGDGAGIAAEDSGADWLDGGEGTDQLLGGAGNDTLLGGADTDNLEGEAGDDLLIGGAGGDVMQGGEGNDTYVLEVGDAPIDPNATDAIADTQGNNTVRFGAGVSAPSIVVNKDTSGRYLLIDYTGTDRLAIDGGFGGAVSRFEFADGTVLSAAELIGRFYDDPVNIVIAAPGQNLLGGTEGDHLESSGGGATLSGGRGNDRMVASGGNNVYLYNAGDGNDTIRDTSAKTDTQGTPQPNTLRFGAGIRPEDITLSLRGTALVLAIGGAEPGEIALEIFDRNNPTASPSIDRFEFAGGASLTFAQLLERGIRIAGTAYQDVLYGTEANDIIDGAAADDSLFGLEGNDVLIGGEGADSLYGYSGDDRLDGGAGDDYLEGWTGNDTFVFGRGDGRDQVNAYGADGGFDTIELTAGLTEQDIAVWRVGDDLQIRIRDSGESAIVMDHFLANSAISGVRFADGTFWDRATLEAHITPVTATAFDDTLTLSEADDDVDALAGNDTVYGRGGKSQSPGDGERRTTNHIACAGARAPSPPAARGVRCRTDQTRRQCDRSSARPASASRIPCA
ncbi:MAG: hypothetical protein L6Q55_16025 [Azonexus sp.]|nr:calcium-binding protein [Azonexus sp.]MCK6413908.1 hypothetical protein [Azonexus sp.]